MSDYVYLIKHAPDARIEVTLWKLPFALHIYENTYSLDGKVVSKQSRKRAKSEAESRRLADELATKLIAKGFQYKGKAPASKPRVVAKPPPWFTRVPIEERDRLRAAITKAKLEHRATEIEALARPAISFALKRGKAASGVTTRFGGAPDLPAAVAWPVHRKVPLTFVAQFRLDELRAFDIEKRLPAKGLISIFALLPDCELVRAVYSTDVSRLVRRPADDGLQVALATPSVVLTLPPSGDASVRALRLSDDELDRYTETLQAKLRPKRSHQLLGHADAISPHHKRTTELLAQIDSDDAFGFEVGDVETLRVHVPVGQLASGNLEGVRGTILVD